MCIRSSSALVPHIQRWMRRYSSRAVLTLYVEPPPCSGMVPEAGARPAPSPESALSALTGVRMQRPRDPRHLFGRHAHTLEVVVVRTLKSREVRALGSLLSQALDLLHDPSNQPHLERDAGLPQGVLDDHRAGVLAVHIPDLGAEVRGRDELIDLRVDKHPGGVDAGLVAEDVEAYAGLGRRHGDAAQSLHQPRQVAQPFVPEAWYLYAEQITQLQQHLVHGRVAGTLADAVDAGCEDFRPASERYDGVPGPKPEVIVEVHDEWRVGSSRFDLRNVVANGVG